MQHRPASDRHTFEHVRFPRAFYEYGKQILAEAKTGKSDYLMHLYNEDTFEGKLKPYHSSDFAVTSKIYMINGSIKNILRLTLPRPQHIMECRYIYLCHKPSTGESMYFTSELTAQGDYFLCTWTKERIHMILNPNQDSNEVDFIAKSFEELVSFDPKSYLETAM